MPIKLSVGIKRSFSSAPISLERVLEYREKRPKRIDFIVCHRNSLTREEMLTRPDIVGKFGVPFAESIRPLFERETGLDLFQSKYGDGWWRSVRGEAEFGKIQEWIEAQGTRIFLRSCLDLSIALDYNIADVGIGQYTDIGELEHRAKTNNDSNAVDLLSSLCIETIRSSAFYAEAAFVSAVPAMSEKEFDVPSQISGRVAAALCRQDLTAEFKCKNPKELPLKDARMEEKWALLEKTGLFLGVKLPDKSKVILIDDKYQSGTTMQFVAMKLQEAGAKQIFGISLVKTLRDTDNAS